jgi:hypothetical protein
MAALHETREHKVFGSCAGQDSEFQALFVTYLARLQAPEH